MKKIFALIMAAALIGTMLTACSTGKDGSSSSSAGSSASGATSSSAVPTGLSGSITAAGSSALQPLVKEAADEIKNANPDVSITVNAGGSGQGLQNVSDKTVDIGNSDVFAAEKLDAGKASALVDHKVCVIGVAAVVNPDVTVTNLTKQQLVDIFTGKITNWKDVGGSDDKIVIINRPASSGTRALFKKFALDGKDEATGVALTEDNSGTLRQNVAQTKGAISYLALSYTKDSSIKVLSLDGVTPTYDNIYSGKYPVWGYEHMYTNGEASGIAKSLIDYMTSDTFAAKAESLGYGAIGKMQTSRSN